ncbi:MAG: DUF4157 domain-containing protein [Deltaproteobacteria bacterium]|nr:DUF4157 domain-containing protein [Deltaproteobacteria bacterium]
MDTPLDDVRVHTGDEAAQTLNSVGGDAATLGQHVFLGGPVADVHSPKGRRALAHELQHVGQDQRGEVHGEEGITPVSAPTEHEAHGAEAKVASEAQAALGEKRAAPATLTGPSVASPERTPATPSGPAPAPERRRRLTADSAPAPVMSGGVAAPVPEDGRADAHDERLSDDGRDDDRDDDPRDDDRDDG